MGNLSRTKGGARVSVSIHLVTWWGLYFQPLVLQALVLSLNSLQSPVKSADLDLKSGTINCGTLEKQKQVEVYEF